MRARLIITAALAATLAGCGTSEPKGQVVATVDGSEITTSELQAEIGGRTGPDAATNKAIQQQALQSIVNRRILAGYARDQKIDKTPVGEIIRHKAVDLSLIGMLQDKLAANVPKPSREEAEGYVRDHPASFSERRLYVLDQVIAPNVPPAIVKAMEPMTAMEPIIALLDANKLRHNASVGVIDSLAIPAEAAQKLAALKTGEVFLTPENGILRISRIRDSLVQPVAGDDAINIALQSLQNERAQAQVSQQIEALIKSGQSKVKLNSSYSLPPAK